MNVSLLGEDLKWMKNNEYQNEKEKITNSTTADSEKN